MIKNHLLILLILLLTIILRIVWLGSIPPSLHSDEVSLAYNAYSILKTGHDEHGSLLPVSLRAFGDWKPGLESYLMIPSILIFGLNEFAVRFPSMVLGILSVLMTYLLVKKIFVKDKERLGLLAAFFIALSPWHLHQSRSAILMMPGLFLLQLGVLLFIRGLKNKTFFFLSLISFGLSLYSYHSLRIVSPLICIYLFFIFRNILFKNKKQLIMGLFVGFLTVLPLLISFFYERNVIFGRVKSISIFYDKGAQLKIWEFQTQDGISGIKPKISLFFHNKPYQYFLEITKRFISHFELNFLLIEGDHAPPFTIPNMGLLYFVDAVFFPLGLYLLVRKLNKYYFLIIFWLFISIIPAALSYQTPTQSRTFNAVFPTIVLCAYGFIFLFQSQIKMIKYLAIIMIFTYTLNFHYYLINYYKILPNSFAADWYYGFKEVNKYIQSDAHNYSKIVFFPKASMAYIFILFYNKYPPEQYIHEAKHNYFPDEAGFEHVDSFNKFYFVRKEPKNLQQNQMKQGELYVGREMEIPLELTRYEVLYPDGKTAFRIAYLN